jgi:hypothetical protein
VKYRAGVRKAVIRCWLHFRSEATEEFRKEGRFVLHVVSNA